MKIPESGGRGPSNSADRLATFVEGPSDTFNHVIESPDRYRDRSQHRVSCSAGLLLPTC